MAKAMRPILPSSLAHARSAFPLLRCQVHGHPLIYFDSAATAQKPQSVIDAISNFYSERYATVHRAIYALSQSATHDYHTVRCAVRLFLNAAKEEEIIFTRGTTASINTVAYCFGKAFVRPGDEIIISILEHHSNIVPWQMMCEERGAHLKVIASDETATLFLDDYKNLLSEKTRLVAIAHISNAFGTVHPIKEMAALAHSAGARVLIDGAQAAPHIPIDVQDLGADFYAFSGHKIYGPTGVGVLYGKEELLELMPPYQGGGDMIETVTMEKTSYHALPLKFEAGTPMIAEVIGLGAALAFIKDIGLEEIHRWEQQLLCYAVERLQEVAGLRIVGTAAKKGAIISFVVEGVHPLDIGTLLDLQGIAIRTGHHCAQPAMRHFGLSGTARLSFGLYNTIEEIDRFIEALKQVIEALR